MTTNLDKNSRIRGAFYGALLGDAMGVPVEFYSRDFLSKYPVTKPTGGDGTAWGMPVGTWSDDGAMLLCTAEVLAHMGLDTEAIGQTFLMWNSKGYWAATGERFDIGGITARALDNISHGVAAVKAGPADEMDNGNGSLMRILPVPLWSAKLDEFTFIDHIVRVAHITHGHVRATAACVFYGMLLREILQQGDRNDAAPGKIYSNAIVPFLHFLNTERLLRRDYDPFRRIIGGHLGHLPESHIKSGGYVIETLEAAVWCFLTTTSYQECVLKAINLGGDTDTTGIVAGGLAGLYYGFDAVPQAWISKLKRGRDVEHLVNEFLRSIERP